EPALVIAVAAAESAFNVQAVSRKGALGLMQVMPATAERYGVPARASVQGSGSVSLMEPKLNAEVGSRYLADLLRLFGGDKELALAAYNAGEGAVLKYGRRIPPYPETQQYVQRVMRFYRTLVR
ncbi:MAG: lytic transglycosylase domain-containing protein, partial [Burkholderiales bacterium]|nr:lytic transglycosylase domain-containing protein [Burkholderiales bacterium]